jgi:hypothetical protein
VKTKIAILTILVAIALISIGYSYACGITICNCNCDVKFTKVITSDNEFEKYVADVSARINCAGDTITVCITNGYPCYMAYINYTIKNTGCKPVHFDCLTIINNHPEALDITTTNYTCTWLCPCDTVKCTTTVHVLQPAKQCWQYCFQIKIGFTCQTCYPHTIGYWKNCFSDALCKNGKPQVPASTLLTYLNQICSQTTLSCFKFTGTQTQKFQQALSILNPANNANMEAKLKAQLLALWLNYMAGCSGGYKYGGKTDKEIIQGSETALCNHQTGKYEYWKDMCDGFNNIGD